MEGNFDKNPPVKVSDYDTSMSKFCGAYQEIFIMSHAYLNSLLPEEAKVLIVGAGTGAEISQFGQTNKRWKLVGVDPSKDMLSIAHRKVKDLNLDNVELVQGFTTDLDVNYLFDGATCILVMHFLEDNGAKLQLLKDIAAKLKDGAPLVLVDAFGDINSKAFSQTLAAWKKYVVIKGEEEEVVEDGFNNQILKRLKFVPEERIQELLQEAGFTKGTRFYTGFLYGGWVAYKDTRM